MIWPAVTDIQGRDERRIEHPGLTTRDRRKRRFGKIYPAGEWSPGRTYSTAEIARVMLLMEKHTFDCCV
jgi:hypothetical protein